MKRSLLLLTALLMMFNLAACDRTETQAPSSPEPPLSPAPNDNISAFNWGGGTTMVLDAEDSAVILALLDSGGWVNDATDCLVDVHLVLPDGELEYHSDCGTFIDYDGPRSLSLTDEKQEQVNAILGRYITLGAVSTPVPTSTWGVTFTSENVTPTSMTLVCTQSGGDAPGELFTGSYYVIERLMPDNCWVPVEPLIDELVWTTEGWGITRNGETRWKVNWGSLYGSLPGGIYRLGKQVTAFQSTGNYDRTMVYAEFGIVENE